MIGVIALKTRLPNDYELLTIMCKIEATLNCRTITMLLSSNVEYWCALSPLSILIGYLHRDWSILNEMLNSSSFQGYPLQVRHKQDWGREFILLLPQTAALPESDAGSGVIKPASSFDVELKVPDGRTFVRDIRNIVHLENLAD